MKKEYKKIQLSDIVAYERNNKKHGSNVDEIVKSIQSNTYIAPIIVDEDNIILAGHGRKLALDKLGVQECEVLQVSGLSDTQKRDFRIRDNKLTELSERDLENLEFELMDLGIQELKDLFDFGKSEKEYDEDAQDDVPDVVQEPIVMHGDMFALGDHILMCGDSMNETDIQKLTTGMSKEHTHCISDPPYGIAYNPEKHGMIQNDDKILDYTQLAKKYTSGFFCMWTGYQVVEKWIDIIQKTFGKVSNMIIWHKGGGGMGDTAKTLAQDFEILLVNHRGNFLQGGYRGNSVWMDTTESKKQYIKKAKKEELQDILIHESDGICLWKVSKDSNIEYMHPTQKPVEINEKVLHNFTSAGDNVLDLFGGSGSNMLACEKMKRKCYMMEIDPKYVQVIIKRYHTFMRGNCTIKCINRDIDICNIIQ